MKNKYYGIWEQKINEKWRKLWKTCRHLQNEKKTWKPLSGIMTRASFWHLNRILSVVAIWMFLTCSVKPVIFFLGGKQYSCNFHTLSRPPRGGGDASYIAQKNAHQKWSYVDKMYYFKIQIAVHESQFGSRFGFRFMKNMNPNLNLDSDSDSSINLDADCRFGFRYVRTAIRFGSRVLPNIYKYLRMGGGDSAFDKILYNYCQTFGNTAKQNISRQIVRHVSVFFPTLQQLGNH